VSRETTTPSTVDTKAYAYDAAGNPTSQTSTRLGATATAETQCYNYDPLARLTAAWTATDNHRAHHRGALDGGGQPCQLQRLLDDVGIRRHRQRHLPGGSPHPRPHLAASHWGTAS
jgi:YD repeat-containing protein